MGDSWWESFSTDSPTTVFLIELALKQSEDVFRHIMARREGTKYHLFRTLRLISIREMFKISLKEDQNQEYQESNSV